MPALSQHGGQAPLFPPPASGPPTSPLSAAIPPSTVGAVSCESSPQATLSDSLEFLLQPSIIPPAATPVDFLPYEIPEQAHPTGNSSVGGFGERCDIQMLRGRHLPCTIASTVLSWFALFALFHHFGPKRLKYSLPRQEEEQWVASSPSWADRTSCKWFGICGASHLSKAGWKKLTGHGKDAAHLTEVDFSDFWHSATADPSSWSKEEHRLREIPDYVFEYAPYVHLFSGEEFWPCDIAEHLIHTTPHLNYTPLQAQWDHPNLTNLDELNQWGRYTYLQSNDNVEDRPEWLGGSSNIPDTPDHPSEDLDYNTPWSQPGAWIDGTSLVEQEEWYEAGLGDTPERGGERPSPVANPVPVPSQGAQGEEWSRAGTRRLHPRQFGKRVNKGGRSDAPAVLIVIDKGHGVVDAFWFYFYSYNLGNVVLNVRFGNHVGDWEHSVVRFHNGEPKAVFFSEHNFGEAYGYDAVEKIGKRPVAYSATGTHAMYATPGTHPYVLPWGLLHDETDRGPLWDPLLNYHSFTYDYRNDILRSSTVSPLAPIEWFYYIGHWGDKFYPLNDPRQYRFAGQYHYVNGPLGPRFKNLGRKKICQGNDECIIKHWDSFGEVEVMQEQDAGEGIGTAQLRQ